MKKKPFKRHHTRTKRRRIVAYDLETTRIEAGTPRPLYITAYTSIINENDIEEVWKVSEPIGSIEGLLEILEQKFLTPEFKNARFVAWNGNNYDVFFIAAALLHSKKYFLRPYLTRSKSLRGLRVMLREDEKVFWEFLDGIAMTGITKPLKDFLKTFAPDYQKLDVVNFDKENFDSDNPVHVAYAERDSEGLYYALLKAAEIVEENFNFRLQSTIGNLGIKIFQSFIPENVLIWEPPLSAIGPIKKQVMRGGYCYSARKYEGPVWKYDINQAYAAAMRETKLPCGRCIQLDDYEPGLPAIYKVCAIHKKNIIPFYYKNEKGKAYFENKKIESTWVTSIEYDQLKSEGWKLKILDGFYWTNYFSMSEYVNRLEMLRSAASDGPSGAQGLMMKSIGNNSYGKTVETLDGLELIMSLDRPNNDFHLFQAENEQLQHVWFKIGEPVLREYHQPQIGAFITAHVRMVVRRAALQNPEAFIYADTDCVVFSEYVNLDIDPKRYGAWKIESRGEGYRFIGKKIYAKIDGSEKHAKGLNVKALSNDDFIKWFNGETPVQNQLHKNNFVKCMTGAEMFHTQIRKGTQV